MQQGLERLVHKTSDVVENKPALSVSVIIRACNQRPELESLIGDIAAQQGQRDPQIIVLDAGSTDGTASLASDRGLEIVKIDRHDPNVARTLNQGFRAADNEWVLCLNVAGSLAHDRIFDVIRRWEGVPNTCAVSGLVLEHPWPGRLSPARLLGGMRRLHALRHPAHEVRGFSLGALPLDASCVKREAWKAVGGIPEDVAPSRLSRSFIHALLNEDRFNNRDIYADPALTVLYERSETPVSLRSIDLGRQVAPFGSTSTLRPKDISLVDQYAERIPDVA